jgi:hypothetical protein
MKNMFVKQFVNVPSENREKRTIGVAEYFREVREFFFEQTTGCTLWQLDSNHGPETTVRTIADTVAMETVK